MKFYATDTVSLIRHLTNSKNLGEAAKKIFESADAGKCVILIPAIVLMEILYLSEKRKILTTLIDVTELIKESINYKISEINLDVVLKATEITDIKDLHDRIIAATAAFYNIELITCDEIISKSKYVRCIW